MSSSSPPFAFIPSEESSNPLCPLYLCTTFGFPQCKTMQCRLCTSSQIVFIGDLSHERDVQFARNLLFFLCTRKMTVMLVVLNQATDEKSPNWIKKVKTIGKELRGKGALMFGDKRLQTQQGCDCEIMAEFICNVKMGQILKEKC